MDVMKIEEIVGDVILVILDNYEVHIRLDTY